MKQFGIIILGLGLYVLGSVSSSSQQEPAWAQKTREVSAGMAPVATPASAVILRLQEHYSYVGAGGIEWLPDGQVVEYATSSSNAPAISMGMNAADAIALAVQGGRKCIHAEYGFLVFSSGN